MTAYEIAMAVVENGYLKEAINRYDDNSINWNYIDADLFLDNVVTLADVHCIDDAFELLEECIEDYTKVLH